MKNIPYATHDMAFHLYIKVAISLKTNDKQYAKVRAKYLDFSSKYSPSLEQQILQMPLSMLQPFYKELKDMYVPV